MLSFDEIDGVMIGPLDISGSYGQPGKLTHPDVVKAINTVIDSCKKFNKSCGTQIADPNIKNVSQLSPQKQKEVNHFLVRELKDQLTKFADKVPPYQLLKQFADKVIYAQKAVKQKPSSSKPQQSPKKWKPYQGRPGDLGSI